MVTIKVYKGTGVGLQTQGEPIHTISAETQKEAEKLLENYYESNISTDGLIIERQTMDRKVG